MGQIRFNLGLLIFVVFFLIDVSGVSYDRVKEAEIAKPARCRRIDDEFKAFFRTELEQKLLEQQLWTYSFWNDSVPADFEYNSGLENCSFSCPASNVSHDNGSSRPGDQPLKETAIARISYPDERYKPTDPIPKQPIAEKVLRRSEREILYNYHGCCISYRKYITPPTALSMHNDIVTVHQCPGKKQYFLVDICRHIRGCTGCTCGMTRTVVMAVVKFANGTLAPMPVKIRGCCKCYRGKLPSEDDLPLPDDK